jgi:hypothetical protein
VSLEGDYHGIPVVSQGQSNYELFSLDTSKGPVQFPVEVHVASRQADEKRKRNAGASARFRQRRKEKEREANATIDKLRDDLRAAREDSQYYKAERDRYLELLKGTHGWEQHVPKSPSPATKRPPRERYDSRATSAGGATPSSPQSGTSSEAPQRPPEGDRNTRRRLESYSLPLPSPTGSQAPPPQFHAPQGGPSYGYGQQQQQQTQQQTQQQNQQQTQQQQTQHQYQQQQQNQQHHQLHQQQLLNNSNIPGHPAPPPKLPQLLPYLPASLDGGALGNHNNGGGHGLHDIALGARQQHYHHNNNPGAWPPHSAPASHS